MLNQSPEPVLPSLPVSLAEKKPQLSGACPSKANLLMFLAALPISFILGVVAHFVGILVGFIGLGVALLPNIIAESCGWVVCMFVVFAFIAVLAVVLGYPFLVGMAGGEIVGQLGKKGLCRNPKVSAMAGLINGIPIYLGHLVTSLLMQKGLASLTVTAEMFEAFDWDPDSLTGLLFVLIPVELAMLLWGAYQEGKDSVANSAFCEEHQVWYGKWYQGFFNPQDVNMITLALQENDMSFVQQVRQVTANDYPHLLIKTRSCPVGAECDVEFFGSAFWKETTVDKKGKQQETTKSKIWTDIMIPAQLGRDIQTALKLQLTAKEKKNKKA